MVIGKIEFENEGYVNCRSCWYACADVLQRKSYEFSVGVNRLPGEIDSGVWSVSTLLSMTPYLKEKDRVLSSPLSLRVNGNEMPLAEFCRYSCYMDESFPLFRTKRPVSKIVERELKRQGSSQTPQEICDLFQMTPFRFERSLSCVGNEIFKAMAILAHLAGKQVFCFPWMSEERFQNFHENMTGLLGVLEKLEKIVILPVGINESGGIHRKNGNEQL